MMMMMMGSLVLLFLKRIRRNKRQRTPSMTSDKSPLRRPPSTFQPLLKIIIAPRFPRSWFPRLLRTRGLGGGIFRSGFAAARGTISTISAVRSSGERDIGDLGDDLGEEIELLFVEDSLF